VKYLKRSILVIGLGLLAWHAANQPGSANIGFFLGYFGVQGGLYYWVWRALFGEKKEKPVQS